MNKIPTICVDTNILIHFYEIEKNKGNKIDKMKRNNIYYDMHYLYRSFKNGKIRIVIPPTVFREIENGAIYFGKNQLEFLKNNNFYVYNYPKEEKREFVNKIFNLAKEYSTPLSTADRKMFAKMHNINAKDLPNYIFKPLSYMYDHIIPQRDALIMAESSLIGLPLVTENYKDFFIQHRYDLIAHINHSHGLSREVKPLSCKSLANKLYDRIPVNLTRYDDHNITPISYQAREGSK